ncbi:MAG: DinB family protein [Mycobacteriales bacterium]|nr:MAG: hypothetical protein DLM56_05600 [Pseudonocardiales bacterium]
MTTADEHELLLHTLQRQRRAIANAVSGLTEEQVRSVPSASSMSLGSLLKHVVGEHRALGINVGGVADVGDAEAEWHSGWVLADDETTEALLARFDDVAAETAAIVRARSLDDAVDLPEAVRRYLPPETEFTVRWMLLHAIEEEARHAGHADVIRESIDGAHAMQLAGTI